MAPAITIAFQVLAYLVENREQIKGVILNVQELLKDAPGESRAAAVRGFIGAALNVGDQIEAAWPLVAPVFNPFVAVVKGKISAQAKA